MSEWAVISLALVYLALLFLLAHLLDRRAKRNKNSRLNKWIYALTIPVYCTAWTYYGSVGKAVNDGWEFLAIYLGPILTIPLWWIVIRKMIRICEVQRISTLPDFISSRFDKSLTLSVLSSILIVVGIIPYISIQLKSISSSFDILVYGEHDFVENTGLLTDSAFYLSLILALFIITFVFRSIETTDKHIGMMGAIAIDSVVKLVAFLIVGGYVTFYLFDGFGDIFSRVSSEQLMTFSEFPEEGAMNWFFLLLLSMSAIILLPRQFQVAVAENTNEDHLRTTTWLFPLYLLLINLFVVPIALGGQILLPEATDPDTYVLALPMLNGEFALAGLTFLGGFSASTGMIVVSTIALSLTISNNVVVPIRIRRKDFGSNYPIQVRKIVVFAILILAYVYYRFIADKFPLVSIGLISFAAMIQFAPAVLGALFWRDAHSKGVLYGLIAGFIIWTYTLVVPTIVEVGILPQTLLTEGPFGIGALRPHSFFGLEMSLIAHGTFWSLFANVSVFILVSIFSEQSAKERNMAEFYTDIYENTHRSEEKIIWRGQMVFQDVVNVCKNILGKRRTKEAIKHYQNHYGDPLGSDKNVDSRFVNYTERLLSGALGSASARMLIASISKEEEIELDEVVKILKETSEVSRLNMELRLKSFELQRRTEELETANNRLRNLDEEKDDFISTVTHELRTPLTSIKAFVEIVQDNPELETAEQTKFMGIINDEIDRMTRLINDVLDLEKLEIGKIEFSTDIISPSQVISESLEGFHHLLQSKGIQLMADSIDQEATIVGDHDRFKQAIINIVSNAIKYADKEEAFIKIKSERANDNLVISVSDNGRGIGEENISRIFDKFFQARDQTKKKPKGTGLGLSITKKIIELHGGEIAVESQWNKGTTFTISVPLESEVDKIVIDE